MATLSQNMCTVVYYWTGLQEFAESLKQNLAYMNPRTACVVEILKSPVLFKVAVNPETTSFYNQESN